MKALYKIKRSSRFNKSFKRVRQYPGFNEERFDTIITLLSCGETLPEQFHDHALAGFLTGNRECHLASDILLVYSIDNGQLILSLVNIGKHSHLFR